MATLVAGAGGCAPGPEGEGPVLDPVDDQQAYVGSPCTIALRASDPDHDALSFSFSSRRPELAERAHIRQLGDGASAELAWTPLAADVGRWAIDITVSDGEHSVTETVFVDVAATEDSGAPVFRAPLGSGTTLDLALAPCLDLVVLVEDADSARVRLTQRPPYVGGATLVPTGPFGARWHWCPAPAQIEAQDRYPLVLAAADGEHVASEKSYLIVLRPAPAP